MAAFGAFEQPPAALRPSPCTLAFGAGRLAASTRLHPIRPAVLFGLKPLVELNRRVNDSQNLQQLAGAKVQQTEPQCLRLQRGLRDEASGAICQGQTCRSSCMTNTLRTELCRICGERHATNSLAEMMQDFANPQQTSSALCRYLRS